MYVLLAEEALSKVVGGTEVMRELYEHLLGLIKQPNIALRIVPAGASIYPSGGFTLFSFEDEPNIGWVEAVAGHGHPLEQSTHVGELKRRCARCTTDVASAAPAVIRYAEPWAAVVRPWAPGFPRQACRAGRVVMCGRCTEQNSGRPRPIRNMYSGQCCIPSNYYVL